MTSPYREAQEATGDDPRRELVYLAGDEEGQTAPVRAGAQICIAGALGGVLVAFAGHPEIGSALLVVATALGAWTWRRAPALSGLLLRIEGGELTVSERGASAGRRDLVRVRLTELRNVSLDTKSIRKVEPARGAVLAAQFVSMNVGPELDVARIALHVDADVAGDRQRTICLTDAFLSHMHSVEWAGKIRTFLRSHGWIPEDERPEGCDEDDDEEQRDQHTR